VARQAGEKKALLTLLEQAQLVYLTTRFPKKQVLGNPADVERLETGMTKMRAAAKELSASLRAKQTGVQWDELLAPSDSPDLSWRRAKRVGPQVLRELRPLLAGEPELAFILDPAAAAPAKRAAVKEPTVKRSRRSAQRADAG
jgi:hypothetical protein